MERGVGGCRVEVGGERVVAGGGLCYWWIGAVLRPANKENATWEKSQCSPSHRPTVGGLMLGTSPPPIITLRHCVCQRLRYEAAMRA